MSETEKGAPPFEIAPGNDTGNFTVEHSRETNRGLYLPLAWAQLAREVKPQKFKGELRAAAINAKRMSGGIAAELVGLIALALVAGLLLMEVA